jgi:hypothetical protein
MCDCAEMFDQWRQTPDYPTLYRVDREVLVDTTRAFPSVTGIRQDELRHQNGVWRPIATTRELIHRLGPRHPSRMTGRRLRRFAVTLTEWGRVLMFRGPACG